MSTHEPVFRERRSGNFQQIVASFLGHDGLPFASVLSAERITRVFVKHMGLFGFSGVYSTAMVLWAFLAKVLADGKGAACQAAVANVVSHCLQRGIEPPTADTGDYCRKREKVSKREKRCHREKRCQEPLIDQLRFQSVQLVPWDAQNEPQKAV